MEEVKKGELEAWEVVQNKAMEEFKASRHDIREKSKRVVKDFLQQVRENRCPEFKWPPEPDCPAKVYGVFDGLPSALEEERPDAKRFLNQVKESWGYDVDCWPPSDISSLFSPLFLGCEFQVYLDSWKLTVPSECVINSINAEAKEQNKRDKPSFELVSINKAVVCGNFLYLLTLTIRDVEADAEKTIRATVNMPPPFMDPLVEECKLLPRVVPFEPLIKHITHICGAKDYGEHGFKRESDRESREAKQIVEDFLSKVHLNKLDEIQGPPDPHCLKNKFVYRYIVKHLAKEDPRTTKKFLHEVSHEWDHDVFCMPPPLCPFICHKGSQVKFYVNFLKQTTDCVIGKINFVAKEMENFKGKKFELVSVDKVVGFGRSSFILTLSIKIYAKGIVIANQVILIRASVSLRKEGPKLSGCSLVSSILTR